MGAALKTEAVVLRSIRYGEADRIVHCYTPEHGRIAAIAKGSRRTRSRFGGRLEPFFRLNLVLHVGRSDLHTVTAAETLDGFSALRHHGPCLDSAARVCDATSRLFETEDPHPGVYHLLVNELTLLDQDPAQATHANQLAYRLKLLLAAGLAPQLAACAACGERDELYGFSGDAGGMVCAACQASAFVLESEAHTFMVQALGLPLAQAPAASPRALAQVERAIAETGEHHANVRLRSAVAG
jgi:DNA repair protein RecO (recombination protein O)